MGNTLTFQSNEIYGKRYTVKAKTAEDAKLKLQSFIYLQLFDRIDPTNPASKQLEFTLRDGKKPAEGESVSQPKAFPSSFALKKWIHQNLEVTPVIQTSKVGPGQMPAATKSSGDATERYHRAHAHDKKYGKPRRPDFLEDCKAFNKAGIQIMDSRVARLLGKDYSVLENFCEDHGMGLDHVLRNRREEIHSEDTHETRMASECILLNKEKLLTVEEMEKLLGHRLPKKVVVKKKAVIMKNGKLEAIEVEHTQLQDPDTGMPWVEPSYRDSEVCKVAWTIHVWG